ncbi:MULTISPECIES: PPOX class F420-dependent oxidoreductase [unclassified Streptomyces]|uniref:PPOX class F420-dependent oxidoreductase n=1 Tax=Streptomycetaceae TaxID=2062 RepID=UPI002E7841A1|nr:MULTISPECIES: PPOX class F420-dependent oxidoreductase [unclassified Streptomyces]MED7953124.1 PPOX class F420-dependent oxidoreductase [Streptomyces sp. BE303]MEE1829143.1 PPOX class F420-dependent oxidoreductase [Streptomyces sp. BE20]
MAAHLSDQAKTLIDGKSFAVISTLQPDGSPQSSVVWVKRDGDDILFSTVEGRRKHLNLVKDPRVSLVINPPENPYTYLEVRGEVTLTREGGRELIDELGLKYRGEQKYTYDGPDDVRVVVRLSPRKVVGSI